MDVERIGGRALDARKSTDGHLRQQLWNTEPGVSRCHHIGVEQCRERHRTGTDPEFGKGAGTHLDPNESGGTRMASVVVDGHRRTGEDELARLRAIVNCAAHTPPNLWYQLPLVEQSRYRPAEERVGGGLRQQSSVRVSVERDTACRSL